MLGELAAVYDRAALISWTPALRGAYVRASGTTAPPRQPNAAHSLEYAQPQMAGPPFSVTADEVRRLFSPHFDSRKSPGRISWRARRGFAAPASRNYSKCVISSCAFDHERQDMAESRSSGRYLAPALVACAAAPLRSAPPAAELTIDRLFDAPALSGPSITGLRISPDASRVTYLQGKTGRQGSPRSLGLQHSRTDGPDFWWTQSPGAVNDKLSDEEMAAASVSEPRHFPAFWNTPSRPPAGAAISARGKLYYYDLKKDPKMPCCESPTQRFRHGATISPHGG